MCEFKKCFRFLRFAFVLLSISLSLSQSAFSDIPPSDMSSVKENKSKLSSSLRRMRFGMIVSNRTYQISRSSYLGEDRLEDLEEHLKDEGYYFPKTLIYMNSAGYKFPYHFALEEYELQRKYGYKFYHSFGKPRTYLDGRNPYTPEKDIDEENLLGRKAREIFPLLQDGLDGDVEDFFVILKLILDPSNQPVHFHCFGGRHRTGIMAMAIRYLQGGYWVNGPKKEKHDLWLNPAEQEYREYNHTFFREENIHFIRKVSRDYRFIALKNQYSYLLQN